MKFSPIQVKDNNMIDYVHNILTKAFEKIILKNSIIIKINLINVRVLQVKDVRTHEKILLIMNTKVAKEINSKNKKNTPKDRLISKININNGRIHIKEVDLERIPLKKNTKDGKRGNSIKKRNKRNGNKVFKIGRISKRKNLIR